MKMSGFFISQRQKLAFESKGNKKQEGNAFWLFLSTDPLQDHAIGVILPP
jgi:hypothetical protein